MLKSIKRQDSVVEPFKSRSTLACNVKGHGEIFLTQTTKSSQSDSWRSAAPYKTGAGAASKHAADGHRCSVIDSGQAPSLPSFFFIHTISLDPKEGGWGDGEGAKCSLSPCNYKPAPSVQLIFPPPAVLFGSKPLLRVVLIRPDICQLICHQLWFKTDQPDGHNWQPHTEVAVAPVMKECSAELSPTGGTVIPASDQRHCHGTENNTDDETQAQNSQQ